MPGGVGFAGPAGRCRAAQASPLNLQPQKKHNIWKKPLCTWYSGFFHCEKPGFRAGGVPSGGFPASGFGGAPLRGFGLGARIPAIPCSFVHKHHVSRAQSAGGVPDVVPHSPQTLILSPTSTTSLGSKAPAAYRTWCLTPRKPLFLRPEAPRPQVRMGRRPHRRGALSPTNPCSFVRKHHVPRSGWADAGTDVVLHSPQSLVPSFPLHQVFGLFRSFNPSDLV